MKTVKVVLISVVLYSFLSSIGLSESKFHLPDGKRANPIALKGIKLFSLDIVSSEVVPLSAKEEIKAVIEEKFKKSGLPLFIPKSGVMYKLPQLAELKIVLEIIEPNDSDSYIFRVQTFLSRRIQLTEEKSVNFRTDVWKTDVYFFETDKQDMIDKLKKAIMGQTQKFIDSYNIAKDIEKENSVQVSEAAVEPVKKEADAVAKSSVAAHRYVASKNSKVFHKSDCSSAARIKKANLVSFDTKSVVVNTGRRPCKICKP